MKKVILEAIVVASGLTILYKRIPQGTPFRVFIAGFLVHIICEIFGINKWYCTHGAACRRRSVKNVQA